MSSVILRTSARLLLPTMLLLSIVVLLRGHNEPGGGFVGGLLAAAGFAFYALSFGVDAAQRRLRMTPVTIIGAGLLAALVSGLPALLAGGPFMEGQWIALGPLKLGTPLVFDVGVYMVVAGITLLMIFTLEDIRDDALPRR